jgi:type III restriction enzyme
MDGKGGNLPTPIVIGISATPGRFIESVMKDSTRTLEQVGVATSEVQKSGLIKDKLVIRHPEVPSKEDMTLLTSAITKIKEFENKWAEYAEEQSETLVVPLLVIQVPRGCPDELYEKILQKIKSEWPELPDDSIRNSMEGHSTLTVKDKRSLKYIAPPDIQDDVSARVVLFKQALNTGWDCPRAEVMISFAVADDETYVAQTIGRMVRTPLARRVGTDSFLNTVSLYLPDFNEAAVENVVKGLNDGEESITSEVIVDGIIIPRNSEISQGVFDAIENLPSYSKPSRIIIPEITRLNKMANLLSGSDIDKTANNQAKEVVINTLDEYVQSIDDLEEREMKIRYSDIVTSEHSLIGDEDQTSTSSQVPKSIEDLNDLFRAAMRVMPDDSAMTYWNYLCEDEEE